MLDVLCSVFCVVNPESDKFINKNNEDSMRRASAYLSAHPEYRADLVEG